MNRERFARVFPLVLGAVGLALAAARLIVVRSAGADALPAALDLTRLPPELQKTVGYLLILPVGALLTAAVRTIAGFQTFGTLTPSLLAISFLLCDWAAGVAAFVVVMVVGLGGRALLGRFRLQMGPRMGLILTVLVLFLAAAVVVLARRGVEGDLSGVLIPLVVLTMVVERFCISLEENGLGVSIKLLAATLAVAAACLLLLRWAALGRLAAAYPEGELLVAAALLTVGRYSGYRLTELWRFRDLVRDQAEEDK